MLILKWGHQDIKFNIDIPAVYNNWEMPVGSLNIPGIELGYYFGEFDTDPITWEATTSLPNIFNNGEKSILYSGELTTPQEALDAVFDKITLVYNWSKKYVKS